jgi:hypothetical protein
MLALMDSSIESYEQIPSHMAKLPNANVLENIYNDQGYLILWGCKSRLPSLERIKKLTRQLACREFAIITENPLQLSFSEGLAMRIFGLN